VLNVQVQNDRQVLVVTADFEIVQQVRLALRGRGFAVQSAYSHRDAMYMLRQGRHDLLVVDSAMRDRYSGEQTLKTLGSQNLHPPIVAVAHRGDVDETTNVAEVVLTKLDEGTIQRSVMQALKMPVLELTELPIEEPSIRPNLQRLDEIQTLFALGRSLTEVLNLSEVLNRIVEAARRLTNAEEGMILLPDEETNELWLRAKVGIDVEVARNFRIKTQDTLAGSVFRSGKPLLIAEQGPQKIKTEYYVNSLLYVPILLRGKPIGVFGVNNRHKHDVFEPHDQEMLVNLASYAAIAIENARVHEESVKQARELSALVDASKVINSSVALERTLTNICEQLLRVLNVSRSAILEWDRDAGCLRMLAHSERAIWRSGYEPKLDLTERPAVARALELGKPFMVSRNRRPITGELKAIDTRGAYAMLFLPVMATGGAIGGLFAYYIRKPDKEPSEDALARAQRLAMHCLAHSVDRTPQGTESAFRTAQEVNTVLASDWAEFGYLAPDRKSLSLRVTAGGGYWLSAPYPSLDLANFPGLHSALEAGEVVHFRSDDESMPPDARELLAMMRSRAVLGLPMVNRGQTHGMALFADTERVAGFSAHEVHLASAIVGQASTALENARLVHDLEASLRELRETQGRLIQAARLSAMGELAAAVAHQINNPLTTIVLDAELMLLNEPPDSPRREPLTAIVRSGKRAAGVVRRLLVTARRPDAGALEPIDVAATINEVFALVRGHIERDQVRLIKEIPDIELPRVDAPVGELDDVWLNLLLNGHDALKGRADAELGIKVQYTPDDETIKVIVWDNGPGIPEDVISDIFKPFFTTKPVGEGTGLGLHICRQVVERIGGSISVESAPDKGTRFLVQLPVRREE